MPRCRSRSASTALAITCHHGCRGREKAGDGDIARKGRSGRKNTYKRRSDGCFITREFQCKKLSLFGELAAAAMTIAINEALVCLGPRALVRHCSLTLMRWQAFATLPSLL